MKAGKFQQRNRNKQIQPNQKSRTENFNIRNVLKTLNKLYHKIDMKKSIPKKIAGNNEMIESKKLRVNLKCSMRKIMHYNTWDQLFNK